MKIVLVGPGVYDIPPKEGKAVESLMGLIWDIKIYLEKLGHEAHIINVPEREQIIEKINHIKPDFVHIQYDVFTDIYPYINFPTAVTSHYGYLEQPARYDAMYRCIMREFEMIKPYVFCLSEGIKNIYVKENMPSSHLRVLPNGVNLQVFNFTNEPIHRNRSIYLAKIEDRKRQHLFQSIDSLYFAGNIINDQHFKRDKNYLGAWSKEQVYKNLTHYGNLVLLADGEAHSLVCVEALAAGLGLVVSEWSSANLDTSKGFITVIKESEIADIAYIERQIVKNREYAIQHRQEIHEYAKQFDWGNILEKNYLPGIKHFIEHHARGEKISTPQKYVFAIEQFIIKRNKKSYIHKKIEKYPVVYKILKTLYRRLMPIEK